MEWEGMGINILLQEGTGMLLYITMGMGWDGNGNTVVGMGGNGIKSHFRTSLVYIGNSNWENSIVEIIHL